MSTDTGICGAEKSVAYISALRRYKEEIDKRASSLGMGMSPDYPFRYTSPDEWGAVLLRKNVHAHMVLYDRLMRADIEIDFDRIRKHFLAEMRLELPPRITIEQVDDLERERR